MPLHLKVLRLSQVLPQQRPSTSELLMHSFFTGSQRSLVEGAREQGRTVGIAHLAEQQQRSDRMVLCAQ